MFQEEINRICLHVNTQLAFTIQNNLTAQAIWKDSDQPAHIYNAWLLVNPKPFHPNACKIDSSICELGNVHCCKSGCYYKIEDRQANRVDPDETSNIMSHLS